MDNSELIAELETKKRETISRIEEFKGYLKDLNAVIEILTLLLPKEVALRAINKEPNKIWTAREIADELRKAHNIRKLDITGLESKKHMLISHGVLISLFRSGEVERVEKGKYRKKREQVTFDKVVTALMAVPRKSSPRRRRKYAGKVHYKEMKIDESVLLSVEKGGYFHTMRTSIRAEAGRFGYKISTSREGTRLRVKLLGKLHDN